MWHILYEIHSEIRDVDASSVAEGQFLSTLESIPEREWQMVRGCFFARHERVHFQRGFPKNVVNNSWDWVILNPPANYINCILYMIHYCKNIYTMFSCAVCSDSNQLHLMIYNIVCPKKWAQSTAPRRKSFSMEDPTGTWDSCNDFSRLDEGCILWRDVNGIPSRSLI